MALETVTYVGDLVATNPTNQDQKQFGDNHINNVKKASLNSFAGWPGMILVTGTEAQGSTVNDFVVTISPAPPAYTTGCMLFKATHTNSGAVTLKINALAAKTLKDPDGNSLQSGDITSGAIVLVYYDGTDFFLVSANDRVARDGDTYTGTHDATAATMLVETQLPGDNSQKAASTAFVVSTALNSSLPGQTGFAGGLLTTDGTNATWTLILDTGAVTPLVGTAFATTTGVQTLTNKKLTDPGFADASDSTKEAHLVLTGIATGQDRAITVEDKDILLMTPGWVALSTVIASNVATVDFDTFIDSTYATYVVLFEGVTANAGSVTLNVRLKVGGVWLSGASAYCYTRNDRDSVNSVVSNFTGISQIPLTTVVHNGSDNQDSGLSGILYLRNPSAALGRKRINWQVNGFLDNLSNMVPRETVGVGALITSDDIVTGVRFLMSSSNILGGTFTLFGMRTK